MARPRPSPLRTHRWEEAVPCVRPPSPARPCPAQPLPTSITPGAREQLPTTPSHPRPKPLSRAGVPSCPPQPGPPVPLRALCPLTPPKPAPGPQRAHSGQQIEGPGASDPAGPLPAHDPVESAYPRSVRLSVRLSVLRALCQVAPGDPSSRRCPGIGSFSARVGEGWGGRPPWGAPGSPWPGPRGQGATVRTNSLPNFAWCLGPGGPAPAPAGALAACMADYTWLYLSPASPSTLTAS